MNRIATAILLFSLTTGSTIFAADINIVNVDRTHVPSFVGYVPNEIVVKFDQSRLGKIDRLQLSHGRTGFSGVDQLGARYNIISILRQFPEAESRNFRGRAIDLSGWHILKFAGEVDLNDLVREYKLIPGILDVQPIGVHAITADSNDSFFNSQWHLNQINDADMDAPEAWDIETGREEITVAVLDTGVRYYHRDLGGANAQVNDLLSVAGNMWVNTAERDGVPGVDDDGNGYDDDILGWDFVDDVGSDPHPLWPGEDGDVPDNNPSDFNGHGTHCAGNVSAISNNGYQVASPAGGYGNGSLESTANGVRVMALRIGYSADWFGIGVSEIGLVRMDWAAQAFYYAADMGARIATCSWGSSNTGGLGAAIDYFLAQGGLIFKSAGNANNEIADYMAGRSDIISVAATDENDRIADFSSYGTWVDISAPGVNILSLYHDHNNVGTDYSAFLDGTSMATPLTASVAALIWSQTPSLSAAVVEQRLYDGADPIDDLNPGFAGKLGAGRVNAFNSVILGGNSPPVAVIGAVPSMGTAPLAVTFSGSSSYDIDGTIVGYSWDFGDGNTSNQADPSHTYLNPDSYIAELTVTDDENATDTDSVTIIVHDEGTTFEYFEDFSGYAEGSDPGGWMDTGANNSMVENDSLFKTYDVGGQMAFGTTSTSANIHSHYAAAAYDAAVGFVFSGRMFVSASTGGIGVTFLSDYPNSDTYYRLRRYGGNAFHLSLHGTATLSGDIDSGVIPTAGTWYRYQIEVIDTGNRTEIRANIWPEGSGEPTGWQIDAYDDSAGRLTSGKIGVWSYDSGSKYWDDFAVQMLSPVNLPPVADFTMTPSTGLAPLLVDFNGSDSYDPDGTIVSFAWDFGDGNNATGSPVNHTYRNSRYLYR